MDKSDKRVSISLAPQHIDIIERLPTFESLIPKYLLRRNLIDLLLLEELNSKIGFQQLFILLSGRTIYSDQQKLHIQSLQSFLEKFHETCSFLHKVK